MSSKYEASEQTKKNLLMSQPRPCPNLAHAPRNLRTSNPRVKHQKKHTQKRSLASIATKELYLVIDAPPKQSLIGQLDASHRRQHGRNQMDHRKGTERHRRKRLYSTNALVQTHRRESSSSTSSSEGEGCFAESNLTSSTDSSTTGMTVCSSIGSRAGREGGWLT